MNRHSARELLKVKGERGYGDNKVAGSSGPHAKQTRGIVKNNNKNVRSMPFMKTTVNG